VRGHGLAFVALSRVRWSRLDAVSFRIPSPPSPRSSVLVDREKCWMRPSATSLKTLSDRRVAASKQAVRSVIPRSARCFDAVAINLKVTNLVTPQRSRILRFARIRGSAGFRRAFGASRLSKGRGSSAALHLVDPIRRRCMRLTGRRQAPGLRRGKIVISFRPNHPSLQVSRLAVKTSAACVSPRQGRGENKGVTQLALVLRHR